MDHEYGGYRRERRDEREVLERVVGQLRIERNVDRHRARVAEHQRVTVGRGARHLLGGDHAARAGNVLDHERLAEGVAELGREHPRQHVGIAARRRRGDQADVLRWVDVLGCGIPHEEYKQEKKPHPRLSTKRGGFTAASKSLAIWPRGSSVMPLFQSGVTTSEPTTPSGTGSPVFSSTTSQ